MCPVPLRKQLAYNRCLVNYVFSTNMLGGMGSTHNRKTNASGISFSAILSCKTSDFGRQLLVCVDGLNEGTATKLLASYVAG